MIVVNLNGRGKGVLGLLYPTTLLISFVLFVLNKAARGRRRRKK